MSDTPETDALREAIDNGAATEAEMTSLAGKLERELVAQEERQGAAGDRCGLLYWADMARARKVLELEEAQETKPHHWEDRALTAELERDEALNVLRDLCDKIALRMMAENPDKERLDLIESHKRAEAVLAKED